MVLATLKFETKLKESIRIRITIFKKIHLERYIVGYMVGNQVLQLSSYIAVKLNF